MFFFPKKNYQRATILQSSMNTCWSFRAPPSLAVHRLGKKPIMSNITSGWWISIVMKCTTVLMEISAFREELQAQKALNLHKKTIWEEFDRRATKKPIYHKYEASQR